MVECACACGCGQLRPKYDKKGRLRKYILYHHKLPKGGKGHPQLEETRKKISESHKGIELSEEHCRNISKSKKGQKSWCKGLKFSKEHRKKLSEAHKGIKNHNFGKPHSEQHRSKISDKLKGHAVSEDTRKTLSKKLKGRTLSKKHLINVIKANKNRTGENHPLWRGGISLEPYAPNFDDVLKKKIRERDNYTCNRCHKWGKMVHHIDYNKKNSDPSNLITLCVSCHMKTNYNRDYWIKYFNSTSLKLYPFVSRLNQVDVLGGYAFSIEGDQRSQIPQDNAS